MSKPRLLDIGCGAGGCSAGYAKYFDVTGLDIHSQPHYPYPFIQADMLDYPLAGYDAYHLSAPCQAYSKLNAIWKKSYPALLPAMRKRLQATGKPYIIENVLGAPIEQGVKLCGSMFGLHVLRHRWFEGSMLLYSPGPCQHKGTVRNGYYLTVAGHGDASHTYTRANVGRAMGISWMSVQEMTQAMPPVYTAWLAPQLLAYIESEAA